MCQCQCRYPPPDGLLHNAALCQLSVNYYQLISTCINLYQVVCLVKVSKSRPFLVTLQEKWLFGGLWLRSRIRAQNKLSEAKLRLFEYIYLSALFQSSSSNSHSKLKLTKVLSDLRLDRTKFLVIYRRK